LTGYLFEANLRGALNEVIDDKQEPRTMNKIHHRTVDVDGLDVFYREAGRADAPVLLLLHGFPSSGHMFRDLIPMVAPHFRVVAPDLPGFGQTARPSRDTFSYTFDSLAQVIEGFTEKLELSRYAVYVFDYGSPVGMRLAMRHPERVTAFVSQNGNAYEEGLSEGWNPMRAFWKDPSQTHRDALRSMLTPETTTFQYTHGVSDPTLVSPDGRSLDDFYLARPGVDEIQLDLLRDYATNVALYPRFQAYLRENKPPVLAVWGKNDPYFLPAGAEAFKRDQPNADVRFYDTGHFALETHATEIGEAIIEFLAKV
jgi:pimeloyl-ACP methyl ester carboxylesterase